MRKTRLWTLLALVIGLTAAIGLAACGDDDSEATTTAAAATDTADLGLIEDGTLIVGSDIPFPPFEQGDPPLYEGFDIDLINEVADRLNLQTQIEDAPFDLLLQGGGGQFDLAIAATTITPARENRVDFSDPYFLASQGLLVRADSDVASFEDLEGKIVGSQDGTTGETYANESSRASEVQRTKNLSEKGFAGEKGSDPKNRNGPKGASHFWGLTPFRRRRSSGYNRNDRHPVFSAGTGFDAATVLRRSLFCTTSAESFCCCVLK